MKNMLMITGIVLLSAGAGALITQQRMSGFASDAPVKSSKERLNKSPE